ncbi:hypothetical protein LCGC14_0282220 [marine sediment metagenome]|uniref:DUF7688 domain-containing protein n=1 Tax=marine sediment metagenome TaxID=412755 RepID=A0A0F9X0W8_9ZZZZ
MSNEFEICIDGKTAISGDRQSISMIFNNLSGKTFLVRDGSHPTLGTYEMYLEQVRSFWEVEIDVGSTIEMRETAEAKAERLHCIGADLPGSYRDAQGQSVVLELRP